jgi:uncharacterized membrane protein
MTTQQLDDPAELSEPRDTRVRHLGTWIEILVSSVLGMVASLVLAVDAIILAADPTADLSCNISDKISCGTVGSSWQASLLGFPNAFIGLLAEPVITTIAVASLGRVRFPRWFMLGAQVVSSIGFIFAYWLFYQAYFVIGALCPWCLLITVTTTLIFFSFTRINVLDGNFGPGLQQRLGRMFRVYHLDTVAAILVIAVLAAMVIYQYL